MKINRNFLGGKGDAKQKTFHGGSMDIFWNCTIKHGWEGMKRYFNRFVHLSEAPTNRFEVAQHGA